MNPKVLRTAELHSVPRLRTKDLGTLSLKSAGTSCRLADSTQIDHMLGKGFIRGSVIL